MNRYIKFAAMTMALLLLLIMSISCAEQKNTPKEPYDTYFNTDNEARHSMTISPPTKTKSSKSPVFVYFHSGAWNYGDKSELDNVFPMLSANLREQGFTVVSANYSLTADGYKWRDCVSDVLDCVQWIYDNADKLSADKDRIVVSGYSSGAHLALCASYCMRSEAIIGEKTYTYKPDLCVDIAGPVNFSYLENISESDGYGSVVLNNALPLLFDMDSDDYYNDLYDINPLNAMDKFSAATDLFVIAGESDTIVPFGHTNDAYSTAITYDIDAEMLTVANATHIFEPADTSVPLGISKEDLCLLIAEKCINAVK